MRRADPRRGADCRADVGARTREPAQARRDRGQGARCVSALARGLTPAAEAMMEQLRQMQERTRAAKLALEVSARAGGPREGDVLTRRRMLQEEERKAEELQRQALKKRCVGMDRAASGRRRPAGVARWIVGRCWVAARPALATGRCAGCCLLRQTIVGASGARPLLAAAALARRGPESRRCARGTDAPVLAGRLLSPRGCPTSRRCPRRYARAV